MRYFPEEELGFLGSGSGYLKRERKTVVVYWRQNSGHHNNQRRKNIGMYRAKERTLCASVAIMTVLMVKEFTVVYGPSCMILHTWFRSRDVFGFSLLGVTKPKEGLCGLYGACCDCCHLLVGLVGLVGWTDTHVALTGLVYSGHWPCDGVKVYGSI